MKEITQRGFYNTAVNRLYYACFYALLALLAKYNFQVQTHTRAKQMLGLHFVNTNKISKEHAHFYSQLFNDRISGDYDDFVVFDKETLDESIPKAILFIAEMQKLIG